jgi:hypothetical protein
MPLLADCRPFNHVVLAVEFACHPALVIFVAIPLMVCSVHYVDSTTVRDWLAGAWSDSPQRAFVERVKNAELAGRHHHCVYSIEVAHTLYSVLPFFVHSSSLALLFCLFSYGNNC